MDDLEERRGQLTQLARDLRAALSNGCPVWLVDRVHECITDLERLAVFDTLDHEAAAATVEAQTLLEVCRSASLKRSLNG